ncbi:MAG: hypothetical protein K2U26_20120, partial [Cyclobacteriaceae bacterium]|nr:hypothetical protein [Cyclobacteriaceae bacterium]
MIVPKLFRWILCLSLISASSLYAQQKFPVTTSTVLTPPYSTYLSDYFAPGSSALSCNFVFNDFREPTWQVRLRLKIESVDLKLETRPDYRPIAPIVVTPGVSTRLAGADLAEYFEFKNLIILGPAAQALQQNGRLPEGAYTFCIEVLDYPTGVLLSNTSCTTVWIKLNDPPRVISPLCGAYIDPYLPLNIPFQWQLANSISPNATQGTEFRLAVYELTDPYANPFTSIANAKVLRIFESEPQFQPSFIYTVAEPALDIGKTYVYQVRANDVGGRDLFKNNGLSEVCWFHYGYPEGGKVNLLFPENDHGYGISDRPYFRWSAPDLRLRNQPFVYEIKIVVLNDGQDLQQTIDTNPVWHTQTTSRTLFDRGMDVVIKKLLRRGLDYAWQVTAYSGNQTVAKSEVRKFKGPPIIDRFFAKTHIVTVKKATTKDSLNFSGVGRVRTGLRDSTDFTFEGLKLRRIGTLWVLTEGSLYNEMSNPVPIILQPRFEKNGTATFYPRAYKLDSRELAIEGEVQWQLPHPVKAGSSIVKSDRSWLNYDEYTLLGAARMSSQNQFDLLEPMDFQLQLSPKSDFLISGNKFELRAEGNLQLPEKIKGKQRGKVKVPFPRTSQLFYIENLNTTFDNDLRLVNNTRIYIHPTTVTIDLSEENSPGRQGANAFWKGVYVQSFELQYHSFTDQFSQLLFKKDLTQTFTGEEAAATNAWVDGLGLNFTLAKTFQNEAITFNSFAGRVQQLDLVIERNNLSSGTFRGGILLPVFSNTDLFSFTIPVTGEGFQPGFLNTLDGKTFVFNKDGGEQEVNLTVQRGVFEDQRVLNMTIDLEWPALGVKAAAVTNFRTWGDYRIGFYTPNGTRALDQHLSARMGGYPVTLDVIAAGSNSGIYSFAVSGKGELGDDVSGEKGPPTVNIFTLSPNSNLPKAAASQTSFSGTANSDQEVANVQSEYDGAQQEVTKKLELDQNEIKNAANATLANLTSSQAATSTVGDVLPQEGVATAQDPAANPKSGGLLARLSPKQREIVKDIIKTVVAELTKPLTKKIDDKAADVNNRIRTRINDMLKRDSVMALKRSVSSCGDSDADGGFV